MSSVRSQFDTELEALRHQVLEMGKDVDWMVTNAVRALIEQDVERARKVIHADKPLDELDIEIEAACLRLIALQQPVARDLRLIGTIFKAITDLERVGDYAVNIAKISRRLARSEITYKPLVDIPRMREYVRQMLKDALSAFSNSDLERVNKVVAADDKMDALYHRMRDDLLAEMQHDPSIVVLGSFLLFVARDLERIADHIVNIAERVYYIETGKLYRFAEDIE